MPSNRHTKIEITSEAYKALEAEAIIQEKTLKKLASEMILKGVSKKALDFIAGTTAPREAGKMLSDEMMVSKAEKEVGATGINIDGALLEKIRNRLLEKGYLETMLYVAQHTASIQRDELHRVLTICEYYKLSPTLAAEVIVHLNKRKPIL
jgi:ribosome biogenesis SPOUT family RNA methylase Rps3